MDMDCEVGPNLGGGLELNPTCFKICYDLCVYFKDLARSYCMLVYRRF